MRKILTFVLLTLFWQAGVATAGGALTGGATEVTQWLNYGELFTQTEKAIKQLEIASENFRSFENLANSASGMMLGQYWKDPQVLTTFRQVQTAVNKGLGLSWSLQQHNRDFTSRYRGFESQSGQFITKYKDWSSASLNSIQGSLATVGMQAQDIDSENEMIDHLQQLSNNPAGQMQALQAGNQISLSMVSQLQKLRQLEIANNQAQNSYLAGQQAKSDTNEDALQKYLDRAEARGKMLKK